MKYFSLHSLSFSDGMMSTKIESVDSLDYSELIGKNKFWKQEFPIKAKLHDYRIFQETGDWVPRYGDLHGWIDGYPSGHSIVVSKRLKIFLNQFNLPEYKWYDVIIQHEKETRAYAMLHLIDNHIKDLYFPSWHNRCCWLGLVVRHLYNARLWRMQC